jgi:hypothetical protein
MSRSEAELPMTVATGAGNLLDAVPVGSMPCSLQGPPPPPGLRAPTTLQKGHESQQRRESTQAGDPTGQMIVGARTDGHG